MASFERWCFSIACVLAVVLGSAPARAAEARDETPRRGPEWIWLNAEGGFETLGLQTFDANRLVDAGVVQTTQTGPLLGAGFGLRLFFLTIGPRFRIGMFQDYQVWTLDAELGIRIPLGRLEPYFTLAGGYASLGAFSSANLGGPAAGDVRITGYDVRGGGGLDLYVTPHFSVGAGLTAEVLGLTRPGVTLSKIASNNSGSVSPDGTLTADPHNLYALDGSSVGFGLTGTLVLGVHY